MNSAKNLGSCAGKLTGNATQGYFARDIQMTPGTCKPSVRNVKHTSRTSRRGKAKETAFCPVKSALTNCWRMQKNKKGLPLTQLSEYDSV